MFRPKPITQLDQFPRPFLAKAFPQIILNWMGLHANPWRILFKRSQPPSRSPSSSFIYMWYTSSSSSKLSFIFSSKSRQGLWRVRFEDSLFIFNLIYLYYKQSISTIFEMLQKLTKCHFLAIFRFWKCRMWIAFFRFLSFASINQTSLPRGFWKTIFF